MHALPIQAHPHSISRISRCPWACLRRCKVGMQDKLQTSSLPDMYNTDRILNPSRPILPALSCPVTSPNFEPQEAWRLHAIHICVDILYMPNPAFRISIFLQLASCHWSCMHLPTLHALLYLFGWLFYHFSPSPTQTLLHYCRSVGLPDMHVGSVFRSVPDMSLEEWGDHLVRLAAGSC